MNPQTANLGNIVRLRETRTRKNGRSVTTAPGTATANFDPLASLMIAETVEMDDTALGATLTLPEFRALADDLPKADRLRLVEQALVLLEQNYVHRPFKEAMHAIAPIQRLRLLEDEIQSTPDQALPSAQVFHETLLNIFLSLRDLHTNYLLPAPFGRMAAVLPFMVEEYFEEGDDEPHFLVSHVTSGFQAPPFAPGVEVVRWNGMPIDRAVMINGNRYAGSNLAARRARGIETLTQRPLIAALPPDEDYVLLEYRTANGAQHELRLPWRIFSPDDVGRAEQPPHIAAAQGIDVELNLVRAAKKMLFAPQVVAMEQALAAGAAVEGLRASVQAEADGTQEDGAAAQELDTEMPGIFTAKQVDTAAGSYGYIHIWGFDVDDAKAFVQEFLRLVAQLPQTGLILDVRGNGGGLIWAGEELLQVLTPQTIQPTLYQFINTPLNLELCRRNSFLAQWADSIGSAVRTAATYSSSYTITPSADANAIGQRYHGPVVLITDALCYSTTDIFAAGFQDHGVGVILGVDDNTGAGGANVWTHDLLMRFLPAQNRRSPYRPLPRNAGMRVSIRRSLRVGGQAGTPIEDLGVVPDHRHYMTRRDLLAGNEDLISRAAELLAALPVHKLTVDNITQGNDELQVALTTQGLTRLDVHVDDRPQGSIDLQDGSTEITIAKPDPRTLGLFGYDDGKLVAARRHQL